ncbi:MAG: PASTA domain-containing protein [Actinobacteria bacterium]|jgi:membrane peptidoglycan carboxypeptidase|nr:PASTA domain-containing protein [Actinomycetota bacterium]
MVNYPRKNKRGIMRFIPSLKQLVLLAGFGIAAGLLAIAIAVKVVAIPQASEIATAQTTILYYDDGVTELARLGDANRVSVDFTQIPVITQHAMLAAEDREFYSHGGFSIRGISRAIYTNLMGAAGAGGGSTITQQYAKNAFLTQERTVTRKAKELVLSIKLETLISKDQILADYMNTIYFGRHAYGIESAATSYFGKSAKDLNYSESAFLAAIVQAPSGLAPEKNLDGLQLRWNYVLDGMVTKGWLSQEERSSAMFPMYLTEPPAQTFSGPQGYLIEQARQTMYASGVTEDQINLGGLRVVTTFNKQAQDAMILAVAEQGPKEKIDGLRIGVASVRPETGEVVAMYGGADYLENQLNNATQMIGQAGSTFKPFTLAAGIESGASLSTAFSGKNKTKVDNYVVVNYGGHSYGDRVTLLKATENSINSAFVELAESVGREVVLKSAIRAGIPADAVGMEPNLAFTLGTASPHVVDIAAAYATFASRGLQVSPSYIKSITTGSGETLFKLSPKPVQAFSTDVADIVTYALQKVVQVGTGTAARALGRPVAGKTGTTNDNKSALFAGYTPELATAVMFVKDGPDGQPVSLSGTGGMSSVTGGSYPARIFTAYMKGALEGVPIQKFPDLPKGQPNGANPTESPSPSAAPSLAPVDPNAPVSIPNLMGVPSDQAISILQELGLNPILELQQGSNATLPLFVLEQSVAVGTLTLPGTNVTLKVVNATP